eukprot:scaffold82874_cov63-Phaeocystis_antarctica.AAC.2
METESVHAARGVQAITSLACRSIIARGELRGELGPRLGLLTAQRRPPPADTSAFDHQWGGTLGGRGGLVNEHLGQGQDVVLRGPAQRCPSRRKHHHTAQSGAHLSGVADTPGRLERQAGQRQVLETSPLKLGAPLVLSIRRDDIAGSNGAFRVLGGLHLDARRGEDEEAFRQVAKHVGHPGMELARDVLHGTKAVDQVEGLKCIGARRARPIEQVDLELLWPSTLANVRFSVHWLRLHSEDPVSGPGELVGIKPQPRPELQGPQLWPPRLLLGELQHLPELLRQLKVKAEPTVHDTSTWRPGLLCGARRNECLTLTRNRAGRPVIGPLSRSPLLLLALAEVGWAIGQLVLWAPLHAPRIASRLCPRLLRWPYPHRGAAVAVRDETRGGLEPRRRRVRRASGEQGERRHAAASSTSCQSGLNYSSACY